MSAEPAFRSIGEVLALLREEFPEVTISKIRFLESQGLIAPERTPSGYRKFYPADIARLRWILSQQKDNFLPLRVIKERLDVLGDDAVLDDTPLAQLLDVHEGDSPVAGDDATPGDGPDAGRVGDDELPLGIDAADAGAVRASASRPGARGGPRGARLGDPEDVGPPTDAHARGYTRAELAAEAGVREPDLAELEAHGLLPRPTPHLDQLLFDDDAALVARIAAAFARHGIEPRHLKMYKHFAEREVALFEQVVMPLLRQRNPEARDRAQHIVAELAGLGRELRTVMLRAALERASEPR